MNKQRNKRTLAKWSGLILMVVITTAMIYHFGRNTGVNGATKGTDARSPTGDSATDRRRLDPSSQRKVSDRKTYFTRDDFLKNSGDVDFLERNLEYAIQSGFLREREIFNLYLGQFKNLKAETVAKLCLADSADDDAVFSGFRSITRFAIERRDIGFLKELFSLVREDGDVSFQVLRETTAAFKGLKPSEIPALIKSFSDLSPSEANALALGLASRLRLRASPTERKEVVREIFSQQHHPEVYERLGPALVDSLGIEASFDWLVSNDNQAFTKGADRQFMRELVKAENYELAQNFIQTLVDQDQKARAQFAVESFLPGFAAKGSDNALQWLESFDQDFITSQMEATVFYATFKEDPGKAEAFANSQTDPIRRELFARLLAGARELFKQR